MAKNEISLKRQLLRSEPYFIDLEVDMSFIKGQTTILSYKIPVNNIDHAVKIASEYLLISERMILTVFVFRRIESIHKRSSRVNYVLMQRIDLREHRNKFPKLPPLDSVS